MPRRRKNVSTDLVVVEQRLRVLGKRITLQEAALLYEALGQHVHPAHRSVESDGSASGSRRLSPRGDRERPGVPGARLGSFPWHVGSEHLGVGSGRPWSHGTPMTTTVLRPRSLPGLLLLESRVAAQREGMQ